MVYDDETYTKTIIPRFIEELYRRDSEDNRVNKITDGRERNIFSIGEIRNTVLNVYGLEDVKLALRGYILENRDKEPIELLNNEANVRLTDAGRAAIGLRRLLPVHLIVLIIYIINDRRPYYIFAM
jgi:hypothetical protein